MRPRCQACLIEIDRSSIYFKISCQVSFTCEWFGTIMRIEKKFTKSVLIAGWALSLCALATGCGKPSIGAIPVKGTILVDGQPMEGVTVIFHPDTGGRAASGKTDAKGEYKLTTELPNDGALAGSYKISVMKHENEKDDIPTNVDPNDPASLDAVYRKVDAKKKTVSKNFIGKTYENHLGSGLIATVESGKDNNFKFEVKSK